MGYYYDDETGLYYLNSRYYIDKKGNSLFYYEAKRPDVVRDYRKYDMQSDNLLLKGEIEQIAEGYSAFKAYLRFSTFQEKPVRFLPENIGFATFLKCACSSALSTA